MIIFNPADFDSAIDLIIQRKLLLIVMDTPYGEKVCTSIRDSILSTHQLARYSINGANDGVVHTGITYSECMTSKSRYEEYFRYAEIASQAIRDSVFPYVSPLDYTFDLLKQKYRGGAIVAEVDGRKMRTGGFRIFPNGSMVEPHQDIPSIHCPASPLMEQLQALVSCNFFIDSGDVGGDFEIWNQQPSKHEFELHRHKERERSYGIRRDYLGPPDISYRPKIGQILIFNTLNVHAVREVFSRERKRITASFFCGYVDKSSALNIFS